jgi:hypothetical protein
MTTFHGSFSVLPGKEDVARSFGAALSGARAQQLDDLQRRCGITREIWTLQQTPAGPVILVFADGDIEKSFTELAVGTDEFTTWYRSQVLEICGLDLATDDQPPSEVVFEWSAS